jgi:hypothetical protein
MDQMLHMVSLLAIFVAIVYFMIIRPQKRKQRRRRRCSPRSERGPRLHHGRRLRDGGGRQDDLVVLKVAEDVKMGSPASRSCR